MGLAKETDLDGRTLLYIAIIRECPEEAVVALVQHGGSAVHQPIIYSDVGGANVKDTVLGVALKKGCSLTVIEALLAASPEIVKEKDLGGNNMLHVALQNGCCSSDGIGSRYPPWLHGPINEKEAAQMVKGKGSGTFLVRESGIEEFTISGGELGNIGPNINGMYIKTSKMANGKPVYVNDGDKCQTCYFTASGRWMVSSSTDLEGSSDGSARAVITGLQSPMSNGTTWEVHDKKKWRAQPQIKTTAGSNNKYVLTVGYGPSVYHGAMDVNKQGVWTIDFEVRFVAPPYTDMVDTINALRAPGVIGWPFESPLTQPVLCSTLEDLGLLNDYGKKVAFGNKAGFDTLYCKQCLEDMARVGGKRMVAGAKVELRSNGTSEKSRKKLKLDEVYKVTMSQDSDGDVKVENLATGEAVDGYIKARDLKWHTAHTKVHPACASCQRFQAKVAACPSKVPAGMFQKDIATTPFGTWSEKGEIVTPVRSRVASNLGNREAEGIISALAVASPGAVKDVNKYGESPLCLALKNVDVALAFIAACPEAIHVNNGHGKSPLHLALRNEPVSEPLVHALVSTYPDSVMAKNANGDNAVHVALKEGLPKSTLKILTRACPGAVKEKDGEFKAPMEIALEKKAWGFAMAMISACPSASQTKPTRGKTLLHIVLENSLGGTSSGAIALKLIAAWPDSAKEKDNNNNIPLHLALQSSTPQGSNEVGLALLAAWSDAVKSVNNDGVTPLHIALANGVQESLTLSLITACPEVVKQVYTSRMLSLSESPAVGATVYEVALKGTRGSTVWHCPPIFGKVLSKQAYEFEISGIKGTNANAKYNGRYRETSNIVHGKVVFGKVDDQNAAVSCYFTSSKRWMITNKASTKIKEGDNVGIVETVARGLPLPISDSATWKVYQKSEWTEQAGIDVKKITGGFTVEITNGNNQIAAGGVRSMMDAWHFRKPQGSNTLLHTALMHTPSLAVLQAMVAIHPDNVEIPDQMGDTPVHVAVKGNCPSEILQCLVDARPTSILKVDGSQQMPLYYVGNAQPHLARILRIAEIKLASLAYLYESFHNPDQSLSQAFREFKEHANALKTKVSADTLDCWRGLSNDLLSTPDQKPGNYNCDFQAATVTVQLQKLVDQREVFRSDTAALSDCLQPIKDMLSVGFQTELQLATPKLYKMRTFTYYQDMYLGPIIEVIKKELVSLKDCVIANPDQYRKLLFALKKDDKDIYDSSFRKSSQTPHGDPDGYDSLLERCAALQSECDFAVVESQPTKELIPLVLMTREQIPEYKSTIAKVLKDADSSSTFAGNFTVIYRPDDITKAPYRMFEKALTKGPNKDYPDCSKIFDVFGCIIECKNYKSMAAVVDAFATQHKQGEIQITRVKDRWTTPSDGGWRDMMLNLVINNVVFEVQVVLTAMLNVRGTLDAHAAYNQFRCFTEIFALLGLSAEISDGSEMLDYTGDTICISATLPPLPQPSGGVKNKKQRKTTKFEAPAIRLGDGVQAATGLANLMGIDEATIGNFHQGQISAIEREFMQHGSEKDKRNFLTVMDGTYTNPPDTSGNVDTASQKSIDELMESPEVQTAGLGRHHVIALRLYTTSSYEAINTPLRTDPPTQPNPFAATTYFISEALKKLRAVAAEKPDAHTPVVYWRGFKGMALPKRFVKEGGTEFGCMSTSASKSVAIAFSKSKHPLVFKFATDNFMARGADISFLSVYPEEKEALYPPLTYLCVIKVGVEVMNGRRVLVASVKPTFPS